VLDQIILGGPAEPQTGAPPPRITEQQE
jgi:hypothetical protein